MGKKFETPIEKEKRELLAYRDRDEEYYKEQLFKNDFSKKEIQDEILENKFKQKIAEDGEWDVPKDYEILYFDPTLSYEITGYRPITMTKGLDFNPTPFTEVADYYEKNNCFTQYPRNSKPFRTFWDEQKDRCRNGYTVGKYRITGDHYFFLNFYRMESPNTTASKKTSGRNESFPSFLSKQYEFFHYLEMCEMLGKDCNLLKARGLN